MGTGASRPFAKREPARPPLTWNANARRATSKNDLEAARREVRSLTFLLHVQKQAHRRWAAPVEDAALGTCSVCLAKEANVACIPCGHVCMCIDCTNLFVARVEDTAPCPICRVEIVHMQRIFLVDADPLEHEAVRAPHDLSLTMP